MSLKTEICFASKREYPLDELVLGQTIRLPIFNEITKEFPDFTRSTYISRYELNKFRNRHLENILKAEFGELTEMEKDVLQTISRNELISDNIEPAIEKELTRGEKISDKIAEFGGSWTFILTFFIFILIWITINIVILYGKAFDPYPFILLNLILSCLAAIQAPVIMMSQNRKEAKDRTRSEYDYKVNLKAELEIRLLHEKLDHLIIHQSQRMIEIQQIQIELMEDIFNMMEKNNHNRKNP